MKVLFKVIGVLARIYAAIVGLLFAIGCLAIYLAGKSEGKSFKESFEEYNKRHHCWNHDEGTEADKACDYLRSKFGKEEEP